MNVPIAHLHTYVKDDDDLRLRASAFSMLNVRTVIAYNNAI
jgi:hypothetical protein